MKIHLFFYFLIKINSLKDRYKMNKSNSGTKKEEIIEYQKKISDPKIFGPVLWYFLSILSISAKIESEATNFMKKTFFEIISNIGCLECRSHAMKYYETNKFTYKNNKSAFDYIWRFHNAVNVRLNKNVMDFETAYNLYTKGFEFCISDCGSEVKTSEVKNNEKNKGNSNLVSKRIL